MRGCALSAMSTERISAEEKNEVSRAFGADFHDGRLTEVVAHVARRSEGSWPERAGNPPKLLSRLAQRRPLPETPGVKIAPSRQELVRSGQSVTNGGGLLDGH